MKAGFMPPHCAAALFALTMSSPALAADPIADKSSAASQKHVRRADKKMRRKLIKIIESCIHDKAATPQGCRQIAYGAALAVGYPKERAEELTRSGD